MLDSEKIYFLATDTESELLEWISKLQLALRHNNDTQKTKILESNYILVT